MTRLRIGLLVALPLAAQSPPEIVRAWRDSTADPSVSAAVGVRGQVVWAQGFGNGATAASMYRIGSVSKPMTAAALMQLVEQGRIDLDAPVQRYVPDFPIRRWPVTTRELAGHLAGVRHYRGNEFLLDIAFPNVDSGLVIFANDTLLFEPGTRYSYSTYGWNLISAVIEHAAGRPFLGVMHDLVWSPLHLDATAPDRKDSVITDRVNFYDRANGVLARSPEVDNSYKWAGGGFLSTPSDLVRFAMAHCTSGLLTEASLRALFTSQRLRNGDATNYGIGWGVAVDDQGRRMVSHSGGSVGGTTMLILWPEPCVSVALTVNLSDAGGLRALAQRLAAPYLN